MKTNRQLSWPQTGRAGDIRLGWRLMVIGWAGWSVCSMDERRAGEVLFFRESEAAKRGIAGERCSHISNGDIGVFSLHHTFFI